MPCFVLLPERLLRLEDERRISMKKDIEQLRTLSLENFRVAMLDTRSFIC
jgi:hypothetical protein